MRINEYPKTKFFDNDGVVITDGNTGTKAILREDLPYAIFDGIPEMHNQIFRGKSLGATPTSDQLRAIRDGNFKDLWIGDYWTGKSGKNRWRIAAFNFFPGSLLVDGEASHIVVIPDNTVGSLGPATNTAGPEKDSIFWNATNYTIKNEVSSDFYSSLVNMRVRVTGHMTNTGWPSMPSEINRSIMWPRQSWIMGSNDISVVDDGQWITNAKVAGSLETQLPLMQMAPRFQTSNNHYWMHKQNGNVSYTMYHKVWCAPQVDDGRTVPDAGFRPVFCIKG